MFQKFEGPLVDQHPINSQICNYLIWDFS